MHNDWAVVELLKEAVSPRGDLLDQVLQQPMNAAQALRPQQ
jgi:hypothetical protein